MAFTFYCRHCQAANVFSRRWTNEHDACEQCQTKGLWTTVNDPAKPWTISAKDRWFLKALRIVVE